MIPPSYGAGNVRSWSDPVVVLSDPRKRAPRAMHEFFSSKIYEIPRVRAARALCASSLLEYSQLDSNHTAVATCTGYLSIEVLNLVLKYSCTT
jgi:hypothetical protein